MKNKIIELLEKYDKVLFSGHQPSDDIYGIGDFDHEDLAEEIEKLFSLPVVTPRFSQKEIDEIAFKWSSERSNGDAEQDTGCMYDFAQGLMAMQKLLLP